ncbi:MAG: T9SS type A sorting domain-containing protein, partial [Bacteroidales bacterium]|nr:T9SS type A sorting domain-containing protein [Bacteroidales bacterium]
MGQFKVVNTALGINDEILNSNLTVYPIPTNGKIYINTQNGATINKVEILDILGRSLKTIDNFKKGQAIDLQNKSKGLFYVKIFSDKGTVVKKVLIN